MVPCSDGCFFMAEAFDVSALEYRHLTESVSAGFILSASTSSRMSDCVESIDIADFNQDLRS